MAEPVRFAHKSLVDAIDTTELGVGGMASLRNLIPDPRNVDVFVCRPAVQLIPPSVAWAGKISVFIVVGTYAYGLVAAVTGPNAGQDVPFAFNLVNGQFITITGVTTRNVPYTFPTDEGDWEPPTCDVVGASVVFTHPLFNTGFSVYYGVLDVSNPSAPVWWGGNISTPSAPALGMPARPSFVRNFGQRAWFAINPKYPTLGEPSVFASDVLDPMTASAIYAFTFGDNETITALAGLPLSNQLGGIIQSLMVFKSSKNIFQIIGDPALANLSINTLNMATGTVAPRSITNTPRGLSFLSPQGVRFIGFDAQVSDPLGSDGKGFNVVFRNLYTPSRAAFSASATTMRASVRNGLKDGAPTEEYWYDMPRSVWTGPHDQPIREIHSYGATFVVSLVNALGLYLSNVVQSNDSAYTELGVQMTFDATAAYWPDTTKMSEIEVQETTVNVALGGTDTQPSSVDIAVFDELATQLDLQSLSAPLRGVWGTGVWGTGVWGAIQSPFQPRRVDWALPIVARRVYHSIKGSCSGGFVLGDLYARVAVLNYLQGVG